MMMTCEEFRNGLEKNLIHPSPPLSDEMRIHAASCRNCEAYRTSLIALHTALHQMPHEKLPEGFSARLKAISRSTEHRPARLTWVPEIRHVSVLSALAVVMIAAQWFPLVLSTIIQCAVLVIGLSTFMIAMLKPLFGGHQRMSVSLTPGLHVMRCASSHTPL